MKSERKRIYISFMEIFDIFFVKWSWISQFCFCFMNLPNMWGNTISAAKTLLLRIAIQLRNHESTKEEKQKHSITFPIYIHACKFLRYSYFSLLVLFSSLFSFCCVYQYMYNSSSFFNILTHFLSNAFQVSCIL